MQDRSNIQKPWCELGPIEKRADGWIIKDLLIRWNETTETRQDGETEYVYDAHRFDFLLPTGVQPGRDAVEYYLEQAQATIIQKAQDLAAQEAGFLAQ